MADLTYRPERHKLVGLEVMRCQVEAFDTEAEAFEFSDRFKVGG